MYLGSSSKVLNITSEQNYGAGLLFSLGTGNVISIDTAYFEKNGIKAREDGKTHRNWGVIVKGSPTGSPKAIENIFLAGAGSENAQSIWLVGKGSKATLDLRNIGGGGILKSEWDSYTLTGYISSSITTGIEGCLPRKLEGTINSNWTTLYVRNNGNDNNDGRTSLTAFATIEKAIEVSKAIYTVHTIDCEGLSTQLATIDLKGIDREIMIDGKNTAVIDGSSSGNNGLSIRNSNNVVNINNFAKISRLTLVNCNQVKSINTKFGHKDNSYSGTMEIQNSGLYLKDCTLNGIDATNTTRNGIRLYNSALKTKELILSGYTNYFSISEGSTVYADSYLAAFGQYADSYLAAFGQMTWVDGTGFVIGGNRIRNAAGILTFA
ncbi:hypothetical protein ACA29_17065 [Lederbergia galactosidilytica]|uniref:Uncharacterized protein n=1 Tax=Lederbergia galactosidilytica TaxID=217031 RepID=A0A0Q9XSW9_9BACI|nr:hypothetical protein ACA29_17065 [Lederbergia galactosidilytica]